MSKQAFFDTLGRHGSLALPFDPARARRVVEELQSALGPDADPDQWTALVKGAAGNSPFLARLMLRDPEALAALFYKRADDGLAGLLSDIDAKARQAGDLSTLMSVLRDAKSRGALLIALADIGRIWSVGQVIHALSDLAQACLGAAVRWLLADAARRGQLAPTDPDAPDLGSGFAVLAMGKFGARELNYSSDIDLVVFFDPDVMPVTGQTDPRSLSIALARAMVRVMQDVTADGYVFRVDLRLRPDAGSTQVAISFDWAERYYEGVGQNWERAAYIKARPVAGDLEAGTRMLRRLDPFVWRKHLDFAAIEDIHAIKRQIHAHGHFGAISMEGHNVKLGRGGIREIEFFAQTQQLIAGGRIPSLRQGPTVDALRALAAHRMVEATVAEELIESYGFLRRLEHRLQMVDDVQTHDLPRTAEGITHIARFMGYADDSAFRKRVRGHLERVQGHYMALFEKEVPLSKRSGSLVFTGVEDDPETLDTLLRMGFAKPSVVAATIRGWHHGRIRATRSERARALLTKLVPGILETFAAYADPDIIFSRFDRFLSGLPSGVQFFSLIQANPQLLKLLAEILGMAPRFADYLSRNPGILDAMLDPDFLTALPGPRRLRHDIETSIAEAPDFEELLDRTRRFAREHSFRIGLQVLKGMARAGAAGQAFADLAEAVVRTLKPRVIGQMAERHGHVPGGEMVVVGMGKLGSQELTATSDLDLILIYDYEGEASDGARPLHAAQYFGRLSQRLINALTAPTADGKFYEVDMRLRPSGAAGPIAVRLEAFLRYHDIEAWTWERMALTRARVIAGPSVLSERVAAAIRSILCSPNDPDEICKDAVDMRERMVREIAASDPWDVKNVRGGLIDIEFIAQALQLIAAPSDPSVLHPTTCVALERLAKTEHLNAEEASALIRAARFQQGIAQALSVAVDGPFLPDEASNALKLVLARVSGCDSFVTTTEQLLGAQARVRSAFDRLIGPPRA